MAKVEKHPDVAKTLLESLEDGEDAASAIAEIIEGAGRRLAVALANVEGKAAGLNVSGMEKEEHSAHCRERRIHCICSLFFDIP